MLGFGLGLNKWRRVGGGFVGLLDLYPNAAAAYSLRKLRAAYSGSAVRVRKEVSTVSSETDIGFAADGSLDTTSLLAFASDADGGNVWLVHPDDQSGNARSLAQSVAANQPLVVSGGSLVTQMSKPAIGFGSDDFLLFSTPFDGGILPSKSDFTFMYVGDMTVGASMREIFACVESSNDRIAFRQEINSKLTILLGGQSYTTTMTFSGNDGFIVFVNYNGGTAGGTIQVVKISDGTSETSGSLTFIKDWGTSSIAFGVAAVSVNTFTGSGLSINSNGSEFVLWPSNKVADVSTIRTNVKSYYGI